MAAAIVAVLMVVMFVVSLAYGGEGGILGGDSGFVVVRPLAHPLLYAIAFLGAGVTALIALLAGRTAALWIIGATVVLLAFGVAVGERLDAHGTSRRMSSPDGKYVLVVDPLVSLSEANRRVRLEENAGFGSRYWIITCYDDSSVAGPKWLAADKFTAQPPGTSSSGETITVRITDDGPVSTRRLGC